MLSGASFQERIPLSTLTRSTYKLADQIGLPDKTMQPREKKLAALLAGVVGLAVAWMFLESRIVAPLTNQRNQLAAVQVQLEERENRKLDLLQAQSDLSDWRYTSLPPNQFTAHREYQEWLTDLAVMSGWTDPQPELGPRRPLPRSRFYQIPVTIKAHATLEQVARFLYHCRRVALLHRIDDLKLVSPAADGNPLLDVTLKAVGLSLPEAEERQHLFARTQLTSDLPAETDKMQVEPAKGFPLVTGFQVKLGHELVEVRDIDGTTWTVERGVEDTIAAVHSAGSDVELFPVDREAAARSFDDYRSLLENSPFTKPAPPVEYHPEFSPQSLPVVTRGTPWEVPLTVSGWNRSGGAKVFSLDDDAPPGMTIDAETGELSWNPDESVPAGDYAVTVRAASRINSDQRLVATLPVTLREPNVPPVIEEPEPLRAYSGRRIAVQIEARDPDGAESHLKYALTGEIPDGAQIDEQSGELVWTPPLTLELGEYPITVSVTDQGDPPQTVSKVVNITVAEDAALFTKYVGYFGEGGRTEALFYNQATDQKTKLLPGDSLQVAEIDAEVVRIDRYHVELKIASKNFRLPLGKSLRQLLPVGDAEPGSGNGAR